MTKNRVKNFSSPAPPSEWMKMFEVKSCTKLIAAWCPLMSLSGTLGGFQSHSVNEEMSCSPRFRLWLRIGRRTCFSRGRRQLLGGGLISPEQFAVFPLKPPTLGTRCTLNILTGWFYRRSASLFEFQITVTCTEKRTFQICSGRKVFQRK